MICCGMWRLEGVCSCAHLKCNPMTESLARVSDESRKKRGPAKEYGIDEGYPSSPALIDVAGKR
jgi:hypothetical protein